jgi:hypothetical protein
MANRASADRSKQRAKLAAAEAKAKLAALKAQLADVSQQASETQDSLSVFELVQCAVDRRPAPESALHNLASQLQRAGKAAGTDAAKGSQPRGQKRKLLQQQVPHVPAQPLNTGPMAQQELQAAMPLPPATQSPLPQQQQQQRPPVPVAGDTAMWQGVMGFSAAPAAAAVSAAELFAASSAAVAPVAVTMQPPTIVQPSTALATTSAVPSYVDYAAPPLSYPPSFAGLSLCLPQLPAGQQLPLQPPPPQQQQQLAGMLAGVVQALSSLQQPRQQELCMPAPQPLVPQASAAWGVPQQQQQMQDGFQYPQSSGGAGDAGMQPPSNLERLLQQVLASVMTA